MLSQQDSMTAHICEPVSWAFSILFKLENLGNSIIMFTGMEGAAQFVLVVH